MSSAQPNGSDRGEWRDVIHTGAASITPILLMYRSENGEMIGSWCTHRKKPYWCLEHEIVMFEVLGPGVIYIQSNYAYWQKSESKDSYILGECWKAVRTSDRKHSRTSYKKNFTNWTTEFETELYWEKLVCENEMGRRDRYCYNKYVQNRMLWRHAYTLSMD